MILGLLSVSTEEHKKLSTMAEPIDLTNEDFPIRADYNELVNAVETSEIGKVRGRTGKIMNRMAVNAYEVCLVKKMKELKEVPETGPKNVTNALFVGSTAELQKIIKGNK